MNSAKRSLIKLVLIGTLATGALAMPVVASATPNQHANCTADEATAFRDINFFATLPHAGERSFVGFASSSNCGNDEGA